jgi:XisI protein
MADLEIYRKTIQTVLLKYANHPYSYEEVELQTVFDTERDHYQVVSVGWEQKHRVYGCSMHLDIKDDKIWIQWNATDLDIAQKLVHLGILPQDIVIGFHPVNLRQYSDYAVW